MKDDWWLSIGRFMCEVREYSDMGEIPGKETKDQTYEKCGGMENISNLIAVHLWHLLSCYR